MPSMLDKLRKLNLPKNVDIGLTTNISQEWCRLGRKHPKYCDSKIVKLNVPLFFILHLLIIVIGCAELGRISHRYTNKHTVDYYTTNPIPSNLVDKVNSRLKFREQYLRIHRDGYINARVYMVVTIMLLFACGCGVVEQKTKVIGKGTLAKFDIVNELNNLYNFDTDGELYEDKAYLDMSNTKLTLYVKSRDGGDYGQIRSDKYQEVLKRGYSQNFAGKLQAFNDKMAETRAPDKDSRQGK